MPNPKSNSRPDTLEEKEGANVREFSEPPLVVTNVMISVSLTLNHWT